MPEATLICVHGGLDRGGSFARLARRINAFDVVTYDRRGYQGSRDLQPLSFELHVEDLLALARRERARE
jgi:pimeloyl-ACP methyl ester carboxylesterase